MAETNIFDRRFGDVAIDFCTLIFGSIFIPFIVPIVCVLVLAAFVLDIVQLLGTFPQLVGECDLMRLTVGNWVDLLEREPAFAAQCSHLQKEIEAERQKRKEEIAWELEKYRQERDAEAAELSHKFDLECDDSEYADMEYWNTH